jgi:serine/threonine protein kinase
VNHPNLVKLLGYCSVDGQNGIQRLLVYEFMPNRSLEDHLFSRSLPLLPWKTRLQIMLGSAQGLQYLHEGLEIQVSTLSLCKLIMTIQIFSFIE